MKIPNQLKIGGHIYHIIRAPLHEQAGVTDCCARTITLDDTLEGSTLEATLIHEIFHAMNSTLGEEPLGHCLLDSLSEQLYQVFSDNGLFAVD